MSREKQIEEMAEIILDVDRSYYGMECDEIQSKAEASAIYAKGYRKASEVAREMLEGIEKRLALENDIFERCASRLVSSGYVNGRSEAIGSIYGIIA